MMARMLILFFSFFFFGASVVVEVVPPFADTKEADISTTGHEGNVVLKPVFSKAPQLRQLKGKMAAGMIQGHEAQVEYVHLAALQVARSSAFFPQEDLFKLQKVFRR